MISVGCCEHIWILSIQFEITRADVGRATGAANWLRNGCHVH